MDAIGEAFGSPTFKMFLAGAAGAFVTHKLLASLKQVRACWHVSLRSVGSKRIVGSRRTPWSCSRGFLALFPGSYVRAVVPAVAVRARHASGVEFTSNTRFKKCQPRVPVLPHVFLRMRSAGAAQHV